MLFHGAELLKLRTVGPLTLKFTSGKGLQVLGADAAQSVPQNASVVTLSHRHVSEH